MSSTRRVEDTRGSRPCDPWTFGTEATTSPPISFGRESLGAVSRCVACQAHPRVDGRVTKTQEVGPNVTGHGKEATSSDPAPKLGLSDAGHAAQGRFGMLRDLWIYRVRPGLPTVSSRQT
jgi:hypothetical protein